LGVSFGLLRSGKLRFWGGRLAVFAFWLQLAMSTGHMHPEDVLGRAPHPTSQGQSVEAVWPDRDAPSSADPHAGLDGDGCAICAAMHMVAAAVPPLPFELRVPLIPVGALAPSGARQPPAATSFRLFQSRAPPLV
jgi:hypothetical protein